MKEEIRQRQQKKEALDRINKKMQEEAHKSAGELHEMKLVVPGPRGKESDWSKAEISTQNVSHEDEELIPV